MKVQKVFANPLLALAFKDGVEWLGDDELSCSEPKYVKPNEWIVDITDDSIEEGDVSTKPNKNVISGTISTSTTPVADFIKNKIMTPIKPPQAPEEIDEQC